MLENIHRFLLEFMGKKTVTHIRHLAKTMTWRVTATITTMVVAWIVTGDYTTGLAVGGIEFFVKMPIYYFHERAWYKTNFGILNKNKSNEDN